MYDLKGKEWLEFTRLWGNWNDNLYVLLYLLVLSFASLHFTRRDTFQYKRERMELKTAHLPQPICAWLSYEDKITHMYITISNNHHFGWMCTAPGEKGLLLCTLWKTAAWCPSWPPQHLEECRHGSHQQAVAELSHRDIHSHRGTESHTRKDCPKVPGFWFMR